MGEEPEPAGGGALRPCGRAGWRQTEALRGTGSAGGRRGEPGGELALGGRLPGFRTPGPKGGRCGGEEARAEGLRGAVYSWWPQPPWAVSDGRKRHTIV